MREKLWILLGIVVFVTGVFTWSAPAMADQVTTLASFNDPRTAMPQRAGHTIKRIRYGTDTTNWFVLPAGNSIHNALRFNAPAPCTNCVITDMVPNLVYMNDANHADGTTANLDTDALMHHFVLINGSRADPVCPGGLQGQLGERFFASGNERSQLHLPSPFGYSNGSNTTSGSRSPTSTGPPAGRTPSRCGSTSTAAATPTTRSRPATTTRTRTGPRPSAAG